MPEGPEVRIVSEYLNRCLENETIEKIECVSLPYEIKYGELIKEINTFLPQKFNKSFCRGKATFIKLCENTYFSYHLGMTGYWSDKKNNHAHLKLRSKNKILYFHDTRRFGNIKVIDSQLLNSKYNLDRDLLNNSNSIDAQVDFLTSSIKSNQEICKILLNQNYFLGVGNYLKSEILYNTKIHPNAKWNSLSHNEIKKICINTQNIMQRCYLGGGAQIKDFKNPNNTSKLILEVYGFEKTIEGYIVVKQKTKDNRTTYWCPDSQKIKPNPERVL